MFPQNTDFKWVHFIVCILLFKVFFIEVVPYFYVRGRLLCRTCITHPQYAPNFMIAYCVGGVSDHQLHKRTFTCRSSTKSISTKWRPYVVILTPLLGVLQWTTR